MRIRKFKHKFSNKNLKIYLNIHETKLELGFEYQTLVSKLLLGNGIQKSIQLFSGLPRP